MIQSKNIKNLEGEETNKGNRVLRKGGTILKVHVHLDLFESLHNQAARLQSKTKESTET